MKYVITRRRWLRCNNLTKRLLEIGDDIVAVDSLTRPGSECEIGST
jgi:hypothetical protein